LIDRPLVGIAPQRRCPSHDPKEIVANKVERPEVLSELHLGDTIVITYTEALAVSLDKLKKSE